MCIDKELKLIFEAYSIWCKEEKNKVVRCGTSRGENGVINLT